MQVSPAAIVPAQHGGYHAAFDHSHQAKSGVSLQEAPNGLATIRFAEANAFRLFPESIDLRIVGETERANADWRAWGHKGEEAENYTLGAPSGHEKRSFFDAGS